MRARLYALAAIALWAALAALGVALKHVPPFLLTGLALMIGSVLAWPFALRERRLWRVAPRTLVLGTGTLFGYHFFLFLALRLAPAVEVNLVNYLWPLLIVVLAPLYLRGPRLGWRQALAAMLGFAGAASAILGAQAPDQHHSATPQGMPVMGYLLALGSAFMWANYSLQTRRLEAKANSFPTAAVGLFGLLAGLFSCLCHLLLEPAVTLHSTDWLLIAVMGLGPLGAAFFLWDLALKEGDAQQIGLLSYLTPLASTVLLLLVTGRALSWHVAVAAGLIIGAAMLGMRRS